MYTQMTKKKKWIYWSIADIPHSTSYAVHPLPQQHALCHCYPQQKWDPVCSGSSASTRDGSEKEIKNHIYDFNIVIIFISRETKKIFLKDVKLLSPQENSKSLGKK